MRLIGMFVMTISVTAVLSGQTPRAAFTMRLMLRALLEERFGLKVHNEQQDLPIYVLTLSKDGELGPGLRRVSVSDLRIVRT